MCPLQYMHPEVSPDQLESAKAVYLAWKELANMLLAKYTPETYKAEREAYYKVTKFPPSVMSAAINEIDALRGF